MDRRLLVDPVFFFPGHALPARDLPRRPGLVEGAVLGPVAERLAPVPPHGRVPLVDDHLDGHLAAPDARRAPRRIGLCGEPPMTALPVDVESGRNAEKWRRVA